jgi:hypothetical protein
MERNLAVEYRADKFRWDQVRENVREMEERKKVGSSISTL